MEYVELIDDQGRCTAIGPKSLVDRVKSEQEKRKAEGEPERPRPVRIPFTTLVGERS